MAQARTTARLALRAKGSSLAAFKTSSPGPHAALAPEATPRATATTRMTACRAQPDSPSIRRGLAWQGLAAATATTAAARATAPTTMTATPAKGLLFSSPTGLDWLDARAILAIFRVRRAAAHTTTSARRARQERRFTKAGWDLPGKVVGSATQRVGPSSRETRPGSQNTPSMRSRCSCALPWLLLPSCKNGCHKPVPRPRPRNLSRVPRHPVHQRGPAKPTKPLGAAC